jgi:cell division protein FtsL
MKTFMFIMYILLAIVCAILVKLNDKNINKITELEDTIQTQKQIIDYREQEINVLKDEKTFLLNIHKRDSVLYQQFINLKFDMP